MKATDLRIGNIVSDFNSDYCSIYSIYPDPYCRSGIYEAEVRYKDGTSEVFKLTELVEIPLTEDILLKAGFIRNEKHDVYNEFTYPSETIICSIGRSENEGWRFEQVDTQPILHIHMLQNIFYFVWGQELEITL